VSKIDVGDAAEPTRCSPADFTAVTYTIDSTLWPHVVAVAGGIQYTDAEADWVASMFRNVIRSQVGKVQFHLCCSPTQGAASILFHAYHNAKQPAHMEMLDTSYGRAAPFRVAWSLLNAAHSVVLFEPFDDIARHVYRLAKIVETRWRVGLPVRAVRAR
jgi:hypothetical protein